MSAASHQNLALASLEQDLKTEEAVTKDKRDAKTQERVKQEKEDDAQRKEGKNKYRKDKPWDDETVDHWKVDKFGEGDMKGGTLLEESSFATLFPQYREQYLKTIWPDVKACLSEEHGLKAELDLVEGSMTVKTTKKTWDPYIIIKARDLLKLLARSVPFPQAKRILEDEWNCDIVKISSFCRNKEKFVKRRQRLVGPNGSTLKAIELLTDCYILVQGNTTCIMGPNWKGIKQVRRIVEETFSNIHPVYAIKELMIMKELEKDESLKDEDWSRFLPKFRKRNVQGKKLKKKKEKESGTGTDGAADGTATSTKPKKKEKSLFPPVPLPRKEDIQMESGEYFLTDAQKQVKKDAERKQKQQETTLKRKAEKLEKNFGNEGNKHGGESAARKRRKVEGDSSSTTGDLAAKLKGKDAVMKKSKKSSSGGGGEGSSSSGLL